jgi:uncharacterized surface protein with fasciclin (FAS1) repeats
MKTKNVLLSLLLAGSVLFTACNDDTEDPQPQDNNTTEESNTIIDVAEANNFTILLAALDRVDLTSTLEADGPYTVFAPTDEAFADLLVELQVDSLGDISDAVLKDVLLNHVVSGKVMAGDLVEGYVSTLAPGAQETNASLYVNLENGVRLNGRADVTSQDVDADNGVVHVINKVLLIPNVVDAAVANPNFSTLVAALTDSRHDAADDFVGILSAEGPYTVFAPTNAAFDSLLASNENWNGLGDIPIETLSAVLKYHVVAGDNVTSGEITDGAMPETFQGQTITLNTGNNTVTVTDANGGVATVQIADVQTANGVIHAIDKVILPAQ